MLRESNKLTSDSKMHNAVYDFQTDPRWKSL